MGRADDITKEYVRRSCIFADLFNFFLYNEEEVIKPEHLKEMDITEIALPFGNGKDLSIQKLRDVLKILQVMEDNEVIYVLLGTELQTDIHYAMPPRNMLYDAIKYVEQISTIARGHKEKRDISGDAFLSGFEKTDKLIPIITLVVHFGSKKWDGPVTLHEMFTIKNAELLKYIPDYKINLISPESMSEDDFEKFHTEFRKVMKFIKYSENKKALQDMLKEDKSFETVSRDTANVINAVTHSGLKIPENEEVVNMCKAIEDIRTEGYNEGRDKGYNEGRNEGYNEGRDEGYNEGRDEGENRLGKLIIKLTNLERMDDVSKAAVDSDFRQKLYQEFQIA